MPVLWSIVSLIVGPLLGLIGSGSRRGDALGLAFKLVLPSVAAAESDAIKHRKDTAGIFGMNLLIKLGRSLVSRFKKVGRYARPATCTGGRGLALVLRRPGLPLAGAENY